MSETGDRTAAARLGAWLLRALEFCMAVGLFLIAAIVVIQVILSSCFGTSITGANEMMSKLFVYVTAVGAAVAVGRNEHIEITFAVESLPPVAQRWLNGTALIAVVVINAVVIAYSFHWIGVTGDYLIPPTPLPRVVAQLAIPIGSGLAILFCVLRLIGMDRHATDVEQAS